MALIKCVECGKEISDKANACIHCGCPIVENNQEETNITSIMAHQEEHYLIKCKVCGNDISNSAKICIHCGEPLFKEKIKTMKKKKWEELKETEKLKITGYRKDNHLFWIDIRVVLTVIHFIVVLPLIISMPFMDSVGYSMVVATIVFSWIGIFVSYNKKEQKKWYESHIDELYENDIIK